MYQKFSKGMNNQLKWASLDENFIHINIDNEIKEYIWKYNVRERALILFLSYYFFLKLISYCYQNSWCYNDSGRFISESLVLWYRGLRFRTKISTQIGKSVWLSAIHLNCNTYNKQETSAKLDTPFWNRIELLIYGPYAHFGY